MKVVIIGRGFGERVVAPAFAAVPGCTVAAVVSPRDDTAVAAALGARPDLVCVHSPPMLHRHNVEQALATGCRAVLCDKPFGRSSAEAAAMLEAAQVAGARHFVNFEFRREPARRTVRELITGGAIGTVEHIVWTHHSAGSRHPLRPYGWLFDRELGGGWIGAWGSHAVDTLRWLLDDELDVEWTQPATMISQRPDGDSARLCTAEDSLRASLRSRRRAATVTIDSSFAAPCTLASRFTVFGQAGTIENVADRRVIVRAEGSKQEFEFSPPSGIDSHLVAMQAWAETLRNALEGDESIHDLPTFVDGLRCAETLDRLRVSV